MPPVTLDQIRRARERIAGTAVRTPLLPALSLTLPDDNALWLKAENLQRTGSFKLRGAYNAVASLGEDERQRGVITYSSGNHGQAVACAAHLLGIRAVVVMPENAMSVKIAATRQWGAEVTFAGTTSIARHERAMELVESDGYVVIPPYDDVRIIAGQGTAGLEILDDLPDLEAVAVPVGGGGLISGVATAIKALRPEVRVIGVEPEGAADARDSLRRGELTTWDRIDTVADGLRTSRLGDLNFQTIREVVDEIVAVPDQQVLRAVGLLALHCKLVVEPSGAVAPAAIMFGHTGLRRCRIAALISGGNIETSRLQACLELAQHPLSVETPR